MALTPTVQHVPGQHFPITPATSAVSGGMFNLTNADEEWVGTVTMDFYMSPDWLGAIAITGRSDGRPAGENDVPFTAPWPFRAMYLNGQPSDLSMISGVNAQITNTSNILVPASGKTIGILVNCTRGRCDMYYRGLKGPSQV